MCVLACPGGVYDLELPALAAVCVCVFLHRGRSMPCHFPLAPPQTATTSYVCTDCTGQECCFASHAEHINDYTQMHRNIRRCRESEIARYTNTWQKCTSCMLWADVKATACRQIAHTLTRMYFLIFKIDICHLISHSMEKLAV